MNLKERPTRGISTTKNTKKRKKSREKDNKLLKLRGGKRGPWEKRVSFFKRLEEHRSRGEETKVSPFLERLTSAGKRGVPILEGFFLVPGGGGENKSG